MSILDLAGLRQYVLVVFCGNQFIIDWQLKVKYRQYNANNKVLKPFTYF